MCRTGHADLRGGGAEAHSCYCVQGSWGKPDGRYRAPGGGAAGADRSLRPGT